MNLRTPSAGLRAASAVVFLGLSILSCASAIPDPREADLLTLPNDLSGMTLEDLREGRRLYVENCGGCHRLRTPDERTPAQWTEAFVKMRKRVRLTTHEEDRLIAYLRAFARRPTDSSQ